MSVNVSNEHDVMLLVSSSYSVHLKVLSEVAVGERHPTDTTSGTEPEQELLLHTLDPLHVWVRAAPPHTTLQYSRIERTLAKYIC